MGEPTTIEEARKGKKVTSATEKAENSKPKVWCMTLMIITFCLPCKLQELEIHIDDEDKNTGYMEERGTSFFISGVYMISRVTTTFNGGQFTCDVKGHKQPIVLFHLMDDISMQGGEDQKVPQERLKLKNSISKK